ncbi:MAG: hypothetical protein ABI875_02210, partial [Gemmatimonadales bacterium]
MKNSYAYIASLTLAVVLSMPAVAQQQPASTPLADPTPKTTVAPAPAPVADTATNRPRFAAAPIEIQYMRPVDRRGLNVFESPKIEGATYTGFKLSW